MAKTREYMDYLDDNIEIAPAGSQEEYQAAELIADIMADHGLKPAIEEFDAKPFGPLIPHIFEILLFLCLIISGVTEGIVHFVTLALAIISAILLVVNHFGIKLFEGMGPSQRSQNVVAMAPATGDKVVKGSRPIVVVAHYDTPRESIMAGPLGRFQSVLKRIVIPCVIVSVVTLIIQLMVFLPEPVRRVLWVIGLVALIPVFVLAIVAIVDRYLPCTEGANDNKSSVAALLSIMDEVVPADDRVTDQEAQAPSPRRRSVEAPISSPTAPRPTQVVEEVKGVRHGKEILLSLNILPPSCEVVYEEPKVTYVNEAEPLPLLEPQAKDQVEEKAVLPALSRIEDRAPIDSISFDQEEPERLIDAREDANARVSEQEQPVEVKEPQEPAVSEERTESEGTADAQEKQESAVTTRESPRSRRTVKLDTNDEFIDQDDQDEEEDEYVDERLGGRAKDRDFQDRDSRDIDSDYEDEYDDRYEDDEYEDERYAGGGINLDAARSWFSNRISSLRDRLNTMREERSRDRADDEFFEDDEGYEEEWVEDEEEDKWSIGHDEDDAKKEDEDKKEDELVPLQRNEVASGRPEPSSYAPDTTEEKKDDQSDSREEDSRYEASRHESESVEPERAESRGDYVSEPTTPANETTQAQEPKPASNTTSYKDSDSYDDDYDDFEWDDEYDDYDDDDYDYDDYDDEDDYVYDDKAKDAPAQSDDEYADDDEWLDWEDEYEPDDSDLIKNEESKKAGLGSRVKLAFGNGREKTPAYEDDPWEDEYDDYDYDDDYDDYDYDDYDEDQADAQVPVAETEQAPTPASDDAKPAEDVAAPANETATVEENTADNSESETKSEAGDEKGAKETLADPNLLHFDREEDSDILPRDTTGLDTISDSYDLMNDEAAKREQQTPPAAIDDPNWGVSSFEPNPNMNIARRAALFDIPDPTYASVDPLSSDVEYEDDYQNVNPAPQAQASAAEQAPADSQSAEGTSNKAESQPVESTPEANQDATQSADQDTDPAMGSMPEWKGGATTRADLVDENGQPIVVDADELQDAILEMGDDFLRSHDVWFVALGASASDHGGIKAFLEQHRRDIRGAFMINMECIGAGSLGMYVEEGLESPRRADRRLTRLIKSIADDLHIRFDAVVMPWDETDAAAAMRNRVRAVSIVGLGDSDQKALSRTRDDVSDNVSPQQVSDVVRIVCETIRRS